MIDPRINGTNEATDPPESVLWFERIMYSCIVLAFLSLALDWNLYRKYYDRHPVFYPAMILTALLVQIWWIRLVSRGRHNWARIITMMVTLAHLISLPFNFGKIYQGTLGPGAVLQVATAILHAVAFALLCTNQSNSWFTSRKTAA
jgi:hypothetical protein